MPKELQILLWRKLYFSVLFIKNKTLLPEFKERLNHKYVKIFFLKIEKFKENIK
jgi:hypothetical protein